MNEPTIEYVPWSVPTDDERWSNAHVIFGHYYIQYDDGITVAIPHAGWCNTVSEALFDMDNREERCMLLDEADEMHRLLLLDDG